MDVPPIAEFSSSVAGREVAMARLSASINAELRRIFEREQHKERDQLAGVLVQSVEDLVCETLNDAGCGFGRLEYGGDVNFENSTQTFGNGHPMGTGLILEFRGFSCDVSWSETVE